jgi:hypothetical protein
VWVSRNEQSRIAGSQKGEYGGLYCKACNYVVNVYFTLLRGA